MLRPCRLKSGNYDEIRDQRCDYNNKFNDRNRQKITIDFLMHQTNKEETYFQTLFR